MSKFLECIGVGKIYPGKSEPVEALRGIDFSCGAGDFVCLLGRSGCGKSTLLQMVAGLERPTAGPDRGGRPRARRALDGDLDRLPGPRPVSLDDGAEERRVQHEGARHAGRRAGRVARRFLDMTSLTGFADRYPHELSGGMRQRVGIARALTTDPKALLMDEPFGALDAQTRGKLQDELLQIWQQQRTTVLFVTHSIDEALLLADRILVFTPRPGRIAADIKVDLPRPRAPQSAEFSALARELRGLVGADREID